VDPRCVGTPALIAGMLAACSYVGYRQGPRFVAFFACMYYAMMRPSEVAALTKAGCHLPDKGWGHLTFADSSPAAGRAFTDDGQVHEHRGLKGRTKGRPSRDPRARKPTRRVPVPPELVALLREHIERFGTGQDGRLFRSESGNPIQPSTWWQVWQKVRALALTPAQVATPLLRRPYDLRHSGVTWRLNAGVPPTEVASWAGHSVEVLMRTLCQVHDRAGRRVDHPHGPSPSPARPRSLTGGLTVAVRARPWLPAGCYSNSAFVDSMRSSRPMLAHASRAALQRRARSLSAASSRASRTSAQPTE
jgi:integrase